MNKHNLSDETISDIIDSYRMLLTVMNNKMEWIFPTLSEKSKTDLGVRAVIMSNADVESSVAISIIKTREAIKVIIADLLEVLKSIAFGIYPFMPETAQKMWDQLGLKGDVSCLKTYPEKGGSAWRHFPSGTKTAKGSPLFPRIQ